MEHITLREKCLDKAINKFDELPVIMEASRQFYNFLFSDTARTSLLEASNDEVFEGGFSHDGDMVPESLDSYLEHQEEQPQPPAELPHSDKKHRPLKGLQIDVLSEIIEVHRTGTRPMCAGLSKRMGKHIASIRSVVMVLQDKGYVRLEHKSSRRFWIIPIRYPDGKEFLPKNVVIENGVKVTKCPAAYAEGYGFGEMVTPKNYV